MGRGPAALIPCGCGATSAQRSARLERLGDELGDLKDRTLESFDLDRALVETTWEGKLIDVASQRNFLRSALRRARRYAEAPHRWLYIHGAYGAGKSHIAAAIANQVAAGGRSARFYTFGALLDRLQAAIREGTADELLEQLLAVDLLVIDELAPAHMAEAASDYRFGRLERLINERLDRWTVITSNVVIDDLAAPGDLRAERLADRIAGASASIWMPIYSYRRLQRAQQVAP